MDARPSNMISGRVLAVFGSSLALRRAARRVSLMPDVPVTDDGLLSASVTGPVWIASATVISLSSGVIAMIGAVFSASMSMALTAVAGTTACELLASSVA